MYKFFIILLLPIIVYAKNAILVSLTDGDTAIFKEGNQNIICHLGDLDAPEMITNNKLKKEMKECHFSEEEFISAGKASFEYAKSIIKINQKYEYTVTRYFANKNPVCTVKIPKGLHVELDPHFDTLMISRGFALPYVIYLDAKQQKLFLESAKEAKAQKRGLWKTHPQLMQCLINHRYSLRSLK